MGTYLNPGNDGFARIVNGEYVDKTGLIGLVNRTIGTTKNLICVSRPRRFGKSYAAQMLCAYYDKTCDSSSLFSGLKISGAPSYETHKNRYDIIYLDMANLLGKTEPQSLLKFIQDNVTEEILATYPEVRKGSSLDQTMVNAVMHTGNKFIMIIDEWDAPIREASIIESQYLKFLRMLFKSSSTTPRLFAAAYMTGILPIKKDGSQSAISDFQEYTMLEPQAFAEYVGFTEEEVRQECEKLGRSFSRMKKWYDGYTVGACGSVYNPYSVMKALSSGKYMSYWKKTSAAETLMTYIDMDQEGLQDDIVKLIAGEKVEVDTDTFQNDVETFTSRDDVLTLLLHLGYLTYEEVPYSYDDDDDRVIGLASIPNEEVRTEFENILRKAKHAELVRLVRRSDQLLEDTLAGDEEAVRKTIEEIHDSEYAPTFYNDEQALRYVVKMAYISCVDQYAKVEELPSGRGIADIAFIPKRRSSLPAMVVEMKWNKSPEKAISQIKERKYPAVLKNYGGKVVLVGISYDERTKRHACRIEFISR